MKVCLKCNKKIESLKFFANVEVFGDLFVDKNGEQEWNKEYFGDWENIKFFCPECSEELPYGESEAIEFLTPDEDELAEIMKEKTEWDKQIKEEFNK